MGSSRMLLKSGLAAAILALSTGCVSDGAGGAGAQVHAGLFRQGFEQSDFYPDAGGGPWWLTHDGDLWSQISAHASGSGRGMAVVVRLEVEGEVSPPGRHGHVGAYERELVVSRVVSVEAASEAAFEAAAKAASGN